MNPPNMLTVRARQMFPVIEKYLASNLTQKAFCAQEGLAYNSFQSWLRKYKIHQRRRPNPTPLAPGFIPIHVHPPETTPKPVTSCVIEYSNGEVYVFVNRRRDRMKLLVWDRMFILSSWN